MRRVYITPFFSQTIHTRAPLPFLAKYPDSSHPYLDHNAPSSSRSLSSLSICFPFPSPSRFRSFGKPVRSDSIFFSVFIALFCLLDTPSLLPSRVPYFTSRSCIRHPSINDPTVSRTQITKFNESDTLHNLSYLHRSQIATFYTKQ